MKKINNFGTICKQIGIPINQIRKIESSLSKHDGKLFLIGGCVRNLILKKKVRDNPDLVVNLDFSILIECLNKSKIKFMDVGSKFGSVVILVGNKKFDITSTRSDINPDGRWTKIKFTKDLLEDSKRRDFTFNSIYCDTKGNIYDPNGGIQDLMNKKVRFIGDINLRINEDHLRILRFVRFSLDISGFLEKKALGVCNHNSSKLKKLSYERRMQELEKIIMNSKIENNEIFNELRKLMESTLESKINTNNFLRLCELEAKYNDRSFERRLKFFFRSKKNIPLFILESSDKKLKKRLVKIRFLKSYLDDELNTKLYNVEKIFLIDQMFFDLSDNLITENKFRALYNKALNFRKKEFPLKGMDLLTIGFKPGKTLGEVLKKVELWWVTNNFTKNKNECLKFSKKFLP